MGRLEKGLMGLNKQRFLNSWNSGHGTEDEIEKQLENIIRIWTPKF